MQQSLATAIASSVELVFAGSRAFTHAEMPGVYRRVRCVVDWMWNFFFGCIKSAVANDCPLHRFVGVAVGHSNQSYPKSMGSVFEHFQNGEIGDVA